MLEIWNKYRNLTQAEATVLVANTCSQNGVSSCGCSSTSTCSITDTLKSHPLPFALGGLGLLGLGLLIGRR